jgi:hypothetical protein
MRGLAAAAAAVMACGAKPPEPLPAVTPQTQPAAHASQLHIENDVRVSRPELPDIAALVPDLTEQLRWPLTVMEHPALEPRYPIARDLADPGIPWTELCARGVQNRRDPSHKDELAYLGAWCMAEQHDTGAAVRALAPLQHSSNLGLASAVAFDLVNVMVADVDFAHADKLLTSENLRDPMLWDLLAAAYFEVGKNVDSYQASNTAAQLDGSPRMELRCRRIARLAMLGSAGQKSVFEDELAAAAKQKTPDPVCVDLALRVPCAIDPINRCEPYIKVQHFVPWRAELLAVYEQWPEVAGWSAWLDYAWKARHVWPGDGSLDLVNAAIDAAVGAANCESRPMEDLSRGADAIAIGVPALAAKATWVRTMLVDDRACHDFHDRWVDSHR